MSPADDPPDLMVARFLSVIQVTTFERSFICACLSRPNMTCGLAVFDCSLGEPARETREVQTGWFEPMV